MKKIDGPSSCPTLGLSEGFRGHLVEEANGGLAVGKQCYGWTGRHTRGPWEEPEFCFLRRANPGD